MNQGTINGIDVERKHLLYLMFTITIFPIVMYYVTADLFSEILERWTPYFVRVLIFTHIVSPGTCLRIAFYLDKFAHVTQNSFQIVFSYNVTFRIYPQISISLHPAGLFQLQFVSLRSTTISPSTRVAGIPEALLFWPFRRAFHLHFWYLLFPLLFRCVV